MTTRVEIARVDRVTEELVAALERLIPQLSEGVAPPTSEELEDLIARKGTVLLIARAPEDGVIIGSLTLATYRTPSGVKARIEDVIVDRAARGRGVGEALVSEALSLARGTGAVHVDLTSSPKRAAANRLYQRLGFDLRETNAYRYMLPERTEDGGRRTEDGGRRTHDR